jgi:hypothetical protein
MTAGSVFVIPALVAGIYLTACSGACGWLDTGDKRRYDKGVHLAFDGASHG